MQHSSHPNEAVQIKREERKEPSVRNYIKNQKIQWHGSWLMTVTDIKITFTEEEVFFRFSATYFKDGKHDKG